jgi:hypothetical protein
MSIINRLMYASIAGRSAVAECYGGTSRERAVRLRRIRSSLDEVLKPLLKNLARGIEKKGFCQEGRFPFQMSVAMKVSQHATGAL